MNDATTPIDPTVRGLICCLIDLEKEASALGHGLAANLIAAAYLSLGEAKCRPVNDNHGMFLRQSCAPVGDREGFAGR